MRKVSARMWTVVRRMSARPSQAWGRGVNSASWAPNQTMQSNSTPSTVFRAGCLALALGLTTLQAAPTPSAEGPTIDVKQSGAVGDGAADDTAALQSALNGGKRTVVIPP